MASEESDPFEKTRMSLGEHLEELRSRLFKGVAAVAIAFAFAWGFQEDIARIVLSPYYQATDMLAEHFVEQANAILAEKPELARTEFFLTDDPGDLRLRGFERRPQGIGVGEGFFFILKICLYFAVFVGSPVLLWQMWQFIAAGLYTKERRAVTRVFPVSLGLFLTGVLFGYFVMVPYAMYYLNRSVPIDLVVTNIHIQSFLTFISGLCLAFGAVFQLPLVLSFLAVAGVLTPQDMARYRGHFIVGAFIVAAILTPPDPFTQLMMGIPMILLYEVGILAARVLTRERRKAAVAEAPR